MKEDTYHRIMATVDTWDRISHTGNSDPLAQMYIDLAASMMHVIAQAATSEGVDPLEKGEDRA